METQAEKEDTDERSLAQRGVGRLSPWSLRALEERELVFFLYKTDQSKTVNDIPHPRAFLWKTSSMCGWGARGWLGGHPLGRAQPAKKRPGKRPGDWDLETHQQSMNTSRF